MSWIRRLFSKKVFDDVNKHLDEEKEEEMAKKPKSPKKPKVEKQVEKNLPTFEGLTKLEIDIWARKELGINIDRRRARDYMIEEIHNHLKKEK